MATLTSPGVEVSVINESFYVPSDAGTTPLFIVASSQDKATGAGDSTAAGTQTANANTAFLISSQRELTETFGDPKFYTCLLYTSPSPRDGLLSRLPSSA